MKEKPEVTIIIPMYNSEKYIDNCLKQINLQTKREINIIVVNDGSTDNTLNILNKYKLNNKNLTILSQEHKGVSAARNLGLKNAKTEYIMFLDVDDIYDKDLVECLYNTAVKNNADLVLIQNFNGAFDSKIKFYNNEKALCDLLNGIIEMSCCSKMFRKSICEDEMFNTRLQIYEDLMSMYNCIKKSNVIVSINDEKYHYIHRENSNSRPSTFEEKFWNAIDTVDYILDDILKNHSTLVNCAKKRKYNTYLRIIKIYYLRKGYKERKFDDKYNYVLKELLSLSKKDAKLYFDKKTNYIRYFLLKYNLPLFKLLIKTMDKN